MDTEKQVYSVAQIIDMGIDVALKFKALNDTITSYDSRVTDLEQTDADTELRLVELESNTGGGSSLTMQEVRDEIYRWGVYRDVYAGTGWYKDANGRVYSKDVPSGETKKFVNDPNTYINILDTDLTHVKLAALTAGLENAVFSTSNLSRLHIENINNIGERSIAPFQSNPDVSSWDVGYISNFDNAFRQSTSVTGLDKISVASMTSAVGMFTGTNVDTVQDISGWNTSNLVNAERMFGRGEGYLITTLTNLKGIGALNVSSVTNAKNMFAYATIGDVDFSGWNVGKVLDASAMFKEVKGTLSGLENWGVGNVTSMGEMFYKANIVSDLSTWCVSNFETAPANFSTNIPAEKLPVWGTCPYLGYGWYKDPETGIVECNGIDDGDTNIFEGDTKEYLCVYNKVNITADNMENVATSNITDLEALLWFTEGLSGKDISHWDVSNVTKMANFLRGTDFDGDLSSWKATLISAKPKDFLAGTPIANDLTKHPQWGAQ